MMGTYHELGACTSFNYYGDWEVKNSVKNLFYQVTEKNENMKNDSGFLDSAN